MAGHRHHGPFGIADLLGGDPGYAMHGPRPGNVTRISLPSGPGGETRELERTGGRYGLQTMCGGQANLTIIERL